MSKWRDIRAMLLDAVARHETSAVFHEKHEGFFETVSYGRLLEDVAALDAVLSAELTRGTRVLLLAKDGRLRATVLLALLCGGYSVVLAPEKADTATLAATAVKAGVGALIYDEAFAAEAESFTAYLPIFSMAELPQKIKAAGVAIKAGEARFFEATLDPLAPAISFWGKEEQTFSSEALLAGAASFAEAQGLVDTDILLTTLPPVIKDAVVLGLLAPLSVGASIAFGGGPHVLLANMREVHPTVLLTIPYIAEKIHDKFFALVAENGTEAAVRRAIAVSDPVRPLAARGMLKHRLLSAARAPFGGALRMIFAVGGQLPPQKIKGLRQIGIHAAAMYTAPLVAGVIAATTGDSYRDGTVGKVIKPTAVSLIAPRADGAGEVSLSGKSLAIGHTDGLFTGDIARFDQDGYLTLVGRTAHRIPLSGDDFVCPEALEAGLKQSPLVADAAVLALSTGELAALVYPNHEGARDMLGEAYGEDEVTYALDEWIGELNQALPQAHRIVHFALTENPLPRGSGGRLQRAQLGEFLKGV